ncbi:MAG: hypothetical protein ABW217_08975, partial [Polyangiaceae bacterium]
MLQRVSRTVALLLLLSSLVWASRASAESGASAESEDRKPPDYAGRDEPPPTPGEVLIWVPRVILFPPYLVTEYLIRTPLGWVIAGAERAGVPALLYDF